LIEVELLPDLKSLQSAWEEDIIPIFEECSLMIPARKQMSYSRNVHTSNLETLLAEMQSVARQEAGAIW
jgi:1,2-phenylacetyl-CoA epoxidase catalytic subunit